jgi:hypothetical protein
MSDNNEMTPEQTRKFKRQEFQRKFGRYWLIYLALFGTGALSAISGLLLPAKVVNGDMQFTTVAVIAGIFYAIGFLTNGEGAAYFWFDKLTDHDKDNTAQQWIAGIFLSLAVGTILITSLAAGSFIAFAMGALTDFQVLPSWAQTWVVYAIPVLWVAHFSAGTAFKSMSDEAANERAANAKIRNVTQQITMKKADARAEYWTKHAPDLARQLGEMEAQEEINDYTIKLESKRGNMPKGIVYNRDENAPQLDAEAPQRTQQAKSAGDTARPTNGQ